MKMSDFVPETYRIDQVRDREQFLEIYKGMYNICGAHAHNNLDHEKWRFGSHCLYQYGGIMVFWEVWHKQEINLCKLLSLIDPKVKTDKSKFWAGISAKGKDNVHQILDPKFFVI